MSAKSIVKKILSIIQRTLTHAWMILLSPMRWGRSDWIKVAIVLFVAGGFFLLDNHIKNFILDHKTEPIRQVFRVFQWFGYGYNHLILLVIFYFAGLYWNNPKAQQCALVCLESFLITALFTHVIKPVAGRHRPYTGRPPTVWRPFGGHNGFPSGHSSSAFSVATVLAQSYRNIPVIPPVVYTLSVLTGLARMVDNGHWASDVFMGGVLGYFIARTVIEINRETYPETLPLAEEKILKG